MIKSVCVWCRWHHLPPSTLVWNRWSWFSQWANLEHLNTHTHTKSNTRPAAEQLPSHRVSLTTRQPPGRVCWCTPYVGISMWSVSSLRPVISTPVRLFIGLFPQLSGAGRSESPAREWCHGLFSKGANYPSCFLTRPLTLCFQGVTCGILSCS